MRSELHAVTIAPRPTHRTRAPLPACHGSQRALRAHQLDRHSSGSLASLKVASAHGPGGPRGPGRRHLRTHQLSTEHERVGAAPFLPPSGEHEHADRLRSRQESHPQARRWAVITGDAHEIRHPRGWRSRTGSEPSVNVGGDHGRAASRASTRAAITDAREPSVPVGGDHGRAASRASPRAAITDAPANRASTWAVITDAPRAERQRGQRSRTRPRTERRR
jgi:hypothetical protein